MCVLGALHLCTEYCQLTFSSPQSRYVLRYLLKVYRRRPHDEEVLFEMVASDCALEATTDLPQNVFCERSQLVYTEQCGQHEFRCRNEMCVSADFVCDGVNDCVDNSDEVECGKLSNQIQ